MLTLKFLPRLAKKINTYYAECAIETKCRTTDGVLGLIPTHELYLITYLLTSLSSWTRVKFIYHYCAFTRYIYITTLARISTEYITPSHRSKVYGRWITQPKSAVIVVRSLLVTWRNVFGWKSLVWKVVWNGRACGAAVTSPTVQFSVTNLACTCQREAN